MTKDDIDEVILVGGSSRMLMVPRMVQDMIGITPKLADPDMAVAKGAALMASQTDKGYVDGGVTFGKDKGSRAYGMNVISDEVGRELCFNLIKRNDDKVIEREFDFFRSKSLPLISLGNLILKAETAVIAASTSLESPSTYIAAKPEPTSPPQSVVAAVTQEDFGRPSKPMM